MPPTPAPLPANRRFTPFTLIELLVVVAIIAVLAAMLLPALAAARKKALTILCMNNQKQLSLASSLYGDSYDGRIPQGQSNGSKTDGGPTAYDPWHNFYRSTGDYDELVDGSFHCPLVIQGYYGLFASNGTKALPGEFASKPFGSFSGSFTFKGFDTAAIQNTDNYILWGDVVQVNGGSVPNLTTFPPTNGGPVFLANTWYNSPGGQKKGLWLGHTQKTNVTYADGHAETATAERLLEARNYNNQSPGRHGFDAYWSYYGIKVDRY